MIFAGIAKYVIVTSALRQHYCSFLDNYIEMLTQFSPSVTFQHIAEHQLLNSIMNRQAEPRRHYIFAGPRYRDVYICIQFQTSDQTAS